MPLLTETEAATALGLTERRLRLLRRLGGGPTHVHVSTHEGTLIRYDTDDLAVWSRTLTSH